MLHQAKGRKFPAPPLKQEPPKTGAIIVIVQSTRNDGKAAHRGFTQSMNPFPSARVVDDVLNRMRAGIQGFGRS
ncbi:MAG: hypothetical protein ACOY3I_06030 [Verrucomicrobiota bacterium]